MIAFGFLQPGDGCRRLRLSCNTFATLTALNILNVDGCLCCELNLLRTDNKAAIRIVGGHCVFRSENFTQGIYTYEPVINLLAHGKEICSYRPSL